MLPDDKILPLRHMARRLGISQRWLRAEAEAGRVPHLDADGRLLFVPALVIEALAERAAQMPPNSDGGDI
jgi:hypothetical protein